MGPIQFRYVGWRPYKAMTDAARRRFGHTPTRFSVVARVMSLESCIWDGTLADWVTPDPGGGPPHVHGAVLEVFARTPPNELDEGQLVERIRQAARGYRSGETEHDPAG